VFPDLRQQSAKFLVDLDLPGYAIGGLSVGETKALMHSMLDITVPHLPADKPRYLMGVGAPEDLVEAAARGVDLFDCVLPTRLARNASLFTREGRINIRNAKFQRDRRAIDEGCECYTCSNFSRAYLRHLFQAGELLAYRLGSIHNVHFVLKLMRDMRNAIAAGTFGAFRRGFLESYSVIPHEVRLENRQKRGRRSRNRSGAERAPGHM
jgi:queuine tRNA-ribosyltransferase